jgi:glycosyltransferase involved in cell wall biosynthesis
VNWQAECGVVIPCLNEAAVIGGLVKTVLRQLPRVLVVDDGSTDGTGDIAAAAGALVLKHATTLGKGAALATGLRRLALEHYPWALLMDGDGQHAPADIPMFLEEAERSGASLIIGNRMGQARRMPWLRRLTNRWMSRRLSRLTGVPVPDSQCGFRLLQVPVWAGLSLQTQHFEIESEVVSIFIAAGQNVRFVPIQVIYANETTKISAWSDSKRWLLWWFRALRKERHARVIRRQLAGGGQRLPQRAPRTI